MKKNGLLFKKIFELFFIYFLSISSIIILFLYIDLFQNGFIYQHNKLLKILCVTFICAISVLLLIFKENRKMFLYKISLISIFCLFLIFSFLYFLTKIGFFEKINSIETFREYIAGFNNFAIPIFILIQFLQVVVLPIPAFITVSAGVLMFGPLYNSLYSCIGIISGSIVAYFIGRVLGKKVVKWLIGEENLNKGLKLIKGKDKVVLTFMLLFPFFPDDILCFVAGITDIKPLFFLIMIFITRIISVTTYSFSINNDIIPLNTWWGITIWAIIILAIVGLSILVYKYGDKIEKFIQTKFKKKKR